MNLTDKAKQIRATIIKMSYVSKIGHLGSSLSCVDIILAIYNRFNLDPRDPNRDRFILSKGHAATALYAVLADKGFIKRDELSTYGKRESRLKDHPCKTYLGILECSTGSLGHGLGIGTGIAYSLKLKENQAKVICLLSDGECNEGSTWESAMFGCAKSLNNLIAIVDNNRLQAVGTTEETMGNSSIGNKFASFGWNVLEICGHDITALCNTFDFLDSSKPNAIICNTNKGQGISFMERNILWHYRVPSDSEYQLALAELGQEPLI